MSNFISSMSKQSIPVEILMKTHKCVLAISKELVELLRLILLITILIGFMIHLNPLTKAEINLLRNYVVK